MNKIKEVLRNKYYQVGALMCLGTTAMLPAASAAEGELPAGASTVVSSITAAADSLKSDAVTVISAAVGLGIVFFGAKLLWSKFKGMAK